MYDDVDVATRRSLEEKEKDPPADAHHARCVKAAEAEIKMAPAASLRIYSWLLALLLALG